MKNLAKCTLAIALVSLSSCKYIDDFNPGDGGGDGGNNDEIVLKNHSVTPALLLKKDGFSDIETYSLFSSADTFEGTPDYIFGGSADGAGLLKEGENFTYFVNNEDNYAISRITFDKTFKPVEGAYVLNSDGSGTRVCSATLATPEVHGFGPIFISAGESGPESQSKGVLPSDDLTNASLPRPLTGLGRWNAENAMPMPKEAYPGATVIIIGDDDSGTYGGQVAMYVSQTGDLENGKVFVLRRKDKNTREMDMITGNTYDVEFVEVPNASTNTGEQNNMYSEELMSIAFGRVEDLDYRKGDGNEREVYFNVTGQNNSGANADYSRSKYGRVYKLKMDKNNPLKGKLTLVLDGDDRNGIAKEFQNPDNICVTKNYVYVQEDPNGYGDETHDSYLYQYDIKTGGLKVVFELDHDRNGAGDDIYGGRDARFGAWEYGALIDVSETLGIDDTFMLCIQTHTWRKDEFKGVDGGSIRPNENQGSEVVLLKGLAR
ncbi:PhoX family protein [Galbibacter mesophilus]|uniref:hypothetical protein n=1 Tax=Galbibacter mesophilus TaxID=379069 RepID=UPI00191E93FB|nr:hypothetical protein [Galbibacter mesophilus]MCM5662972.1 hypothetical protein [Galbibacter mesophilus]